MWLLYLGLGASFPMNITSPHWWREGGGETAGILYIWSVGKVHHGQTAQNVIVILPEYPGDCPEESTDWFRAA
jgi:hypothetical protein